MKTFTRFFILFVFAFLAFQSCLLNSHAIYGNGNLQREEISISAYNEILLRISADIAYENDTISPPYLQICADENILPHINVEVKNGKLVIDAKDGVDLRATNLKIITNSANLDEISIEGSGNVWLKGEVNAGEMRMNISGSGSISADSLYCEQAKFNISGSGNIKLQGVSNYTEFNIAGSGNIHALEFSSLKADATITGSGRILLWVGRELNATITGSGEIKYKGSPEIENIQVTGSGRISRIE
ncbi:MAG: DUF2807 domain-containing protein [Dysgonamonadaceae bacterium]|jgi:hypothetical protein|nr:DUF2807 domain-containing protein [Dysgonamonadaceae bacterium]